MLELPEPPSSREVRPSQSQCLYRSVQLFLMVGFILLSFPLKAQTLSLEELVTPSTVIRKDGRAVTFAIHAFVEFQALAESFPYIAAQSHRWPDDHTFDTAARDRLARALVREAVESRVISMTDERPLEVLITHTQTALKDALEKIKEPVPAGYADAFLDVQQKWKHSLNCWSAAPSIPARVLSNWYPIPEGIVLDGATYDSTEHFWQAVKYPPQVTVADLAGLLKAFEKKDWSGWIARLDSDPRIYLPNAYAVEFLRHNLATDRLKWFGNEIAQQNAHSEDRVRGLQQRHGASIRFTAFEEKVLWGDLADLFHLVYLFSPDDDPIRKTLSRQHFDGIYLGEQKMGFISEEFRSLMLEIWKVKYLEMPRFREVIANIPKDIRLEHFLNDGDSPDIPIPIYVEYLNQIRDMARGKSQN